MKYLIYYQIIKKLKILKWKLKYPGKKGFEQAMINTIEWFSDPKNLKFYDSNKYSLNLVKKK